jgi:hypothetical protein
MLGKILKLIRFNLTKKITIEIPPKGSSVSLIKLEEAITPIESVKITRTRIQIIVIC